MSRCYSVNSENYCFYTNGSVLSWNEAREFCALINSTLPIITDEDIDSVFQQFIVNDAYSVIQNTSVWIGAQARPVNNSVSSWHWINGKPSGTDNTVVRWTLDHKNVTPLLCSDACYAFSELRCWILMVSLTKMAFKFEWKLSHQPYIFLPWWDNSMFCIFSSSVSFSIVVYEPSVWNKWIYACMHSFIHITGRKLPVCILKTNK